MPGPVISASLRAKLALGFAVFAPNTSIIEASNIEAKKYGTPVDASAKEYGLPNASPTVEPSERVEVVDKVPQSNVFAIQRAVAGFSQCGGAARANRKVK